MAKSKVGRPSAYKPEFANAARKLCELGAVNGDLAEAFGVSQMTINRWAVRHREFCEALEVGGEHHNRHVRRSLYHKAVGFYVTVQEAIKVKDADGGEHVEVVEIEKYIQPDTVAAKFWLVNKDQANFREKTSTEISGPDGGPIETRNVDLGQLSDDDLKALHAIAAKAQKP